MGAVMAKSLATASAKVVPIASRQAATRFTAQQGELFGPPAQEAAVSLEKQLEKLLLYFAEMAEKKGRTLVAGGLRMLAQIVVTLLPNLAKHVVA